MESPEVLLQVTPETAEHRKVDIQAFRCSQPTDPPKTPEDPKPPTSVDFEASARGAFYTSQGSAPGNKRLTKGCKPALYPVMERAFSPFILEGIRIPGALPQADMARAFSPHPIRHGAA